MFKSKMGGEGMLRQIAGQNNDQKENNMEKETVKKLALITASAVTAGNRVLSGAVKQESQKEGATKIDVELFELLKNEHGTGYSEKELKQLYAHLDDKDFIGISSVGYNYAEKIVPLIEKLKERYGKTKPIILGGDQAIQNTATCWETGVDAVCFGEGEIDFPVLLQNWDNRFNPEVRKTIKNFILTKEDLLKLEDMRAKIKQLRDGGASLGQIFDQLPEDYQVFSRKFLRKTELNKYAQDFSVENTYVMYEGELQKATIDNMFGFPQHQLPQDKNVLQYAWMKGCTEACDYCYYRNMQDMTGETTLRKKSVKKAIEEIKMGVDEIERIRQIARDEGRDPGPEPFVLIMNSNQMALSIKEMEEFRDLYKQAIGLPFYCMNHPRMINEEKMRLMAEAGMVHMNIGVQTNEDSNEDNYSRNQSDENVIKASLVAEKLRAEGYDIKLFLDFIIYSPFEAREDIKKTVDFIKKIKPPFDYIPHTLFLGPESPLRARYDKERAEREGTDRPMDKLLEDCQSEEFSNFHDTYRFYRTLRQNKEFVPNTICEFMAGQINEEKLGRLPRYAKDLLKLDVFDKSKLMKIVEKEIKKKHNPNPDQSKPWERKISNPEWAEKYRNEREADIDNILKFISEKLEQTDKDALSIDFLLSDEVLGYFDDHKDAFINIALNMKDLHPQRFSNEDPKLKKMQYEDEYPDTSAETNFG